MSDLFENLNAQNKIKKRVCRVAYTLNNHQPVISTIIGEQPLFYLDYEEAYEEEAFDAADLGILEDELRKLKSSIESFDKFYESRGFSDEDMANDFAENAKVFSEVVRNDVDFGGVVKTLRQSRLISAYLDFAAEHKVTLKVSEHIERSFYDRQSLEILINPNLDKARMMMAIVQELRIHWQHRQGALIQPLMFHPDNAILINRAQQADLAVAIIRAGWELQLAGELDVWQALENSPMADLARSFARESFLDFRTMNNGVASAAVFENWFLSERCRTADKDLIQNMLADYNGYVFDADENAKGLTADIIAALGEVPYGKNYLATHALTIMNDPIFTDVRDRSNANFLWFIKFERTFRETEQELHTNSCPTEEGVLPDSTNREKKECHHDQNMSADIVTLYAAPRSDEHDAQNKSSGKILASEEAGPADESADNIVYLDRRTEES